MAEELLKEVSVSLDKEISDKVNEKKKDLYKEPLIIKQGEINTIK